MSLIYRYVFQKDVYNGESWLKIMSCKTLEQQL